MGSSHVISFIHVRDEGVSLYFSILHFVRFQTIQTLCSIPGILALISTSKVGKLATHDEVTLLSRWTPKSRPRHFAAPHPLGVGLRSSVDGVRRLGPVDELWWPGGDQGHRGPS